MWKMESKKSACRPDEIRHAEKDKQKMHAPGGNAMRILVVEDEKHLNEILSRRLKENGYSVDACLDGLTAMDFIEMTDYDVIILDIRLPGLSGMEILKRARKQGIESPILMLTALDAVEDKVRGLDAGADDYLTKPFAFEELMARIRMLLRKKSGNKTNVYRLEDLVVDCDARKVKRGEKEIRLSAKEFALLEYMIVNQGIVLDRDRIGEHLWSYEYEGASNMIDVYIRYLRKKVDEGFEPKLIQTVRGKGYVLRVDA